MKSIKQCKSLESAVACALQRAIFDPKNEHQSRCSIGRAMGLNNVNLMCYWVKAKGEGGNRLPSHYIGPLAKECRLSVAETRHLIKLLIKSVRPQRGQYIICCR
jgi:hypothetical protein